MLELGSHSKKLHQSIAPIINKTKIDKVFVKGNKTIFLFNKLLKSKKVEFYTVRHKLLI